MRVSSDSWLLTSLHLRALTLSRKDLSGESDNLLLHDNFVWTGKYQSTALTFKNHSPALRLCSSSQVKSVLLLDVLLGSLSLTFVVLSKNPELWSCIKKGILSLLYDKTIKQEHNLASLSWDKLSKGFVVS